MDEVVCTRCREPVSEEHYNSGDFFRCRSCNASLKVEVFPALFREIEQGKPGETVIDDQASCFYHPEKKAVTLCDLCGRFLCALCDVEWSGRHLCPSCLSAAQKKGKMVDLQRHRVLYDSIALGLAVYPLLLFFVFYFTLVTAPAAIYIAIRHWNSPTSIVGRTKARYVAAIVLSSVEIILWIVAIAWLASRDWSGT